MIYSFFGALITSFSLDIIRDKNVFFSCSVRIEILSIISSVSTLSPIKAVDRFFAVFSVSAKSLAYRNIYYFSF
jgi:hypothetical protein